MSADGMQINRSRSELNVSKGTFFHFFPTKQDLLDALCARIADESWRDASSVLQRADLDPVARLDLFLQATRSWRSGRSRAIGGLWHELARDENAALMNEVSALGVGMLAPAMARLLSEANEKGLTRVEDVEVVARLLVEWLSVTAAGSLRLYQAQPDARAIDLALRRADSTLAAIERVLGIPDGRLMRPDRELVTKVVTAVVPEEGLSSGATDGREVRKEPGRSRSAGIGASGRTRAHAKKGGRA